MIRKPKKKRRRNKLRDKQEEKVERGRRVKDLNLTKIKN